MKHSPEVYFETRNNALNFGDDPNFDPDPGYGLRSGSRAGGLYSLIDCLVMDVFRTLHHHIDCCL